jgi:hypothetical protein
MTDQPDTGTAAVSLPRNGSSLVLLGSILNEANELHRTLRMRRDAARSLGGPEDAADWRFVVRDWWGGRARPEEIEVCTGAELAAKYAWARFRDEDYRPQIWALLGWHLCPVDVTWDNGGLAADTSITCEGFVSVGDTRIGRLSYVMFGPVWSEL